MSFEIYFLFIQEGKSKHDAPKSKRGRKPKIDKVAISKQFVENDDSDASINSVTIHFIIICNNLFVILL